MSKRLAANNLDRRLFRRTRRYLTNTAIKATKLAVESRLRRPTRVVGPVIKRCAIAMVSQCLPISFAEPLNTSGQIDE